MAKHLSLAHTLVGGVIRHGDSVIDATCGNGLLLCEILTSYRLGYTFSCQEGVNEDIWLCLWN